MAKSRIYTWTKETLSFQKLNAEFDGLLTNPMNLISPATATLDMDGFELIMDADADSSLTADSDDILHMRLQAFDAFIFDGNVSTPVNGLTFTSSATATAATITSHGEANVGITITPAGTGVLTLDGVVIDAANSAIDINGIELILDVDADTSITADTDDVIHFRCQAFDAFIMDGDVSTPVNGLTFVSSATGVAPQITDHGEGDTGINLVPSGTGTVMIDGGVLAGKCFNASATWDIGSLIQGAQDTTSLTVTGAVVGDFCLASLSLSLVRLTLTAFVISADTVTVVAANNGATLDLASATLYVRVFSRT